MVDLLSLAEVEPEIHQPKPTNQILIMAQPNYRKAAIKNSTYAVSVSNKRETARFNVILCQFHRKRYVPLLYCSTCEHDEDEAIGIL